MNNNFKCPECDREYLILKFIISINKNGNPVYKDKMTSRVLVCECSTTLTPIEKKGEFNVSFGKFESMSIDKKEKYFKDISKKDFKDNGLDYIREAKKRENKHNNPM